jgi:hypothetical protein
MPAKLAARQEKRNAKLKGMGEEMKKEDESEEKSSKASK